MVTICRSMSLWTLFVTSAMILRGMELYPTCLALAACCLHHALVKHSRTGVFHLLDQAATSRAGLESYPPLNQLSESHRTIA